MQLVIELNQAQLLICRHSRLMTSFRSLDTAIDLGTVCHRTHFLINGKVTSASLSNGLSLRNSCEPLDEYMLVCTPHISRAMGEWITFTRGEEIKAEWN